MYGISMCNHKHAVGRENVWGNFDKLEDEYAGTSSCAPVRTCSIMCRLPEDITAFARDNSVS